MNVVYPTQSNSSGCNNLITQTSSFASGNNQLILQLQYAVKELIAFAWENSCLLCFTNTQQQQAWKQCRRPSFSQSFASYQKKKIHLHLFKTKQNFSLKTKWELYELTTEFSNNKDNTHRMFTVGDQGREGTGLSRTLAHSQGQFFCDFLGNTEASPMTTPS